MTSKLFVLVPTIVNSPEQQRDLNKKASQFRWKA